MLRGTALIVTAFIVSLMLMASGGGLGIVGDSSSTAVGSAAAGKPTAGSGDVPGSRAGTHSPDHSPDHSLNHSPDRLVPNVERGCSKTVSLNIGISCRRDVFGDTFCQAFWRSG